MGKTVIRNVKEYEGKWLVYHRTTKKLSFRTKPQDSDKFLTVGMVAEGTVAGKSVEEWVTQIAKKEV